MERAKARAAVAIASQKLRVGLQKQMPADNNRPCQQTRMYEKEMIAFEQRHMNKQNKSRQWKTWLSRLMLEYCHFIIRRMTFKGCRLSFWDPGVYGQGYETWKYWQKNPATFSAAGQHFRIDLVFHPTFAHVKSTSDLCLKQAFIFAWSPCRVAERVRWLEPRQTCAELANRGLMFSYASYYDGWRPSATM